MQHGRAPQEIFRYKVVYPGGTFVRISPDVESERTGDIIEYGVVFEASKSLVLDGINYVKLSDGRGWVFGNKGDTEVLELMGVTRIPASPAPPVHATSSSSSSLSPQPLSSSSVSSSSSLSSASPSSVFLVQQAMVHKATQEKDKLFQGVRAENRFWKGVRVQCLACRTFDELVQLSCELDRADVACAQGAAPRQSDPIWRCIRLIASIARQCAPDVADLTGLESALWVLVHLGSRASHPMELAVAAANDRFETVSSERQSELLFVVLEAGARAKSHSIDLSKMVDVLPDDIRNFLQRWIIIRSYETEFIMEGDEEGAYYEEAGPEYEVQPTPTSGPRAGQSRWLPSWLCLSPSGECGGQRVARPARRRPAKAQQIIMLEDGSTATEEEEEEEEEGGGEEEKEGFWTGIRRHVKRIVADPDMQLAGII